MFRIDSGTGLRQEMAPKTWSGGSEDPFDDWYSDFTNSVFTGTVVGTGNANRTVILTDVTPFVACTVSSSGFSVPDFARYDQPMRGA